MRASMRSSIASVTEGQIFEICHTAESVAMPAMKIALGQMVADGQLDSNGAQLVIGRGDRLKAKMIAAYKAAITELAQVVTACAKLISGGHDIKIKKTSGKRFFSQMKKLFKGFLDQDFTSYGLDVESEERPETPVQVFELTANATFETIFKSFDVELDDLVLTQDQIISFVEEHKDWLHPEGWSEFFLTKVNGQFFVVDVYRFARGLDAYVYHLSDDYVWGAGRRYRIVVPQQKLKIQN